MKKRLPFLTLTVAVLGLLVACQAPKTLPMQKQSLGQKLYMENCASCHGLSGHGSSAMVQQRGIHFDDPAFQKTLTDMQLKQTIQNGRGMMPAFETTFKPNELDELVKYVRSLSAKPS